MSKEEYFGTMILEISHLSITVTQYERGIHKRELPVIKDLSLQIEPGQIVAAVGASGSGKSLLAHSILASCLITVG